MARMMKSALCNLSLCAAFLILSTPALATSYNRIIVPEACHPAIRSAARIIAKDLGLPESAVHAGANPGVPGKGEIVLTDSTTNAAQANWLGKIPAKIKHDGYAIVFQKGGALIYGVRPRSLLFAAGDVHLWKDRDAGSFVRDPSFAIRTAGYDGDLPVAEYVAKLGVNILTINAKAAVTLKDSLPKVFDQLSPREQARLERESRRNENRYARFAKACHDADVAFYPMLYGNDFRRWSPALYAAALKVYPSARGQRAPDSWEKASLCPSDPMTWKLIDAYVKEFVEQTHADGLYATFWDDYGLYCQDPRCQKDGLNQFPNELYDCVRHYNQVLTSLGKKLIVRTWSSGVPHWFGNQWVHAPGYGSFGGSGTNLWGRVIHDLPSSIIIQTKVYNSDCQPDARFSTLLGHAAPHREIAEYQISGQTRGRFYFPASDVNHTAWTMRKSYSLVGPDGGVNVFPGGTKQSNYNLLHDIANSINVYAWRELSWQVNKNVDQIWMEWAVPIFGPKAARSIVDALKLSENVVDRLFSTLGLGTDTNSGFPGSIQRRETLLKYTNRYYLPQYARFLKPTKENIQRVIEEKAECLKEINKMFQDLDAARPYLTKAQADELQTRFEWLKQFAIVNRNLEVSLWRYRYLRYEASLLTTDPGQMKYLAQAYDAVKAHRKLLFQFNPNQRFSCYDVPLGQLARKPSLGNPMPLMRQLYDRSLALVQDAVGPSYVPKKWRR